MAVREITLNSTWDPEAKVWFATSEDVPGLVLEADTLDGIIEEARSLVPELLRLNGLTDDTEGSLPPGRAKSQARELSSLHPVRS